MKFTPGFVINSLFCFCVRRLNRAGLGMTVLALCVAFAYAETDVQIESVTTSPRGTFRIEQERKQDAGKRAWTTTAWITVVADPSQRSPLGEAFGDENERHFFISPDEQWICATVHEHSQLQSLMLYQRTKGLQFEQVAAEQEEEGDGWHFDTNDRFAPKGDMEQDETGRVYNYFVAWSSDSARLLVERRSQLEAKRDGKNLWRHHYFYFNLRNGKLEHTQYLLTLNSAARSNDAAHKEYVVPAFAEPLDALPPEKGLRERYEAGERRLNKAYPAFLERTEDENEKQNRRRYQQLWLKARESGAEAFAVMGSKAERSRRKLLYLADATENRAQQLEEDLEERTRLDKENKEQAAKTHEAAAAESYASSKIRGTASPFRRSSTPIARCPSARRVQVDGGSSRATRAQAIRTEFSSPL
jgi:uncharacterized protein YecT (DUF1311 family)